MGREMVCLLYPAERLISRRESEGVGRERLRKGNKRDAKGAELGIGGSGKLVETLKSCVLGAWCFRQVILNMC